MRILILLSSVLLLSSCVKYRHLRNFDEGPAFNAAAFPQPAPVRLQPDDLVAISVQTLDPAVSAPFNFGGLPSGAAGATAGASANQQSAAASGGQSYLIDAQGEINFPAVGRLRLQGLTTLEARDTVTARLRKFLTDPIVNVRLLNLRFTVLGEVNGPGAYTSEKERITVLEALGLAGDLTIFGNRQNILVIRERNGVREYGRLDLHQRDVFASPYFYLQQNDVLYVEPLRTKVAASPDEATKYLQYAFPVISVISLVVSLLR